MSLIKDPWFTVEKIDESTFAIGEYGHWEKVISYFLIGGSRAALIDTGLGIDSMKRITDQLSDLPIDVITTHVHGDHIGSHREYENLYVHEADADWLIHGIEGRTLEAMRHDLVRDITIPTPQSFDPSTYVPFQGEPTGLLNDGDTMDIGDRKLVIYHTPGHSPGHITIFDQKKGYLFTGDSLYIGTPVYAYYPSTDPGDLVDSLERIAQIEGVSQIFGAHNQAGIDPDIFVDILEGISMLRQKNLIRHGTGLHNMGRLQVKF